MASLFLQIVLNGILASVLYALIAGGISFLYATTRIFHLAHGVVVVAGGYVFWWGWRAVGLPVWVAAALALVSAALAGVAMNEWVYEVLRRRGAKGLGYLIATLALLVMGTALLMAVFGAAPKTFGVQTPSFVVGGAYLTVLQVWAIASAALLLFFFFWVTHYTKFGKAMRATADNEAVAEVVGIDTKKVRRSAFALSSLLAAAAGILVGLEFNLDPNMGILLAIRGFAAAIIGGVGSFTGALAGALIIGMTEQAVVWFLGAGWRNAATFVILFAFLLFWPKGIFGGKRDA